MKETFHFYILNKNKLVLENNNHNNKKNVAKILLFGKQKQKL